MRQKGENKSYGAFRESMGKEGPGLGGGGGRGVCDGGLNESGGASEQPVGGDLPIKRCSMLGSLICHLCCDARQEILQGHNRRHHPNSSSSSVAPLYTQWSVQRCWQLQREGFFFFYDGWMVKHLEKNYLSPHTQKIFGSEIQTGNSQLKLANLSPCTPQENKREVFCLHHCHYCFNVIFATWPSDYLLRGTRASEHVLHL